MSLSYRSARALAFALVCATVLIAPASLAICGDCNSDGSVNIIDGLRGAQVAAGLATLIGIQHFECDVDISQSVTILDALRIAQFSAGLGGVLACPPVNFPPTLTFQWNPPQDAGLVPFYFRISDPESDLACVVFEFSTDSGSTWQAMTLETGLSEPVPVMGLTTSPTGEQAFFVWDSFADLQTTSYGVDVRAWAEDGLAGPEAIAYVDVQNGILPFGYTAECIPVKRELVLGARLVILPAMKAPGPPSVQVDFPTVCEHGLCWNGATSCGLCGGRVCPSMPHSRTIIPPAPLAFPTIYDDPLFCGSAIVLGTNILTIEINDARGRVYSTAIEVIIQ